MEFEKWQALGNDYVIVEASQLPFELTSPRIEAICASHTGVGADGILLLSEPDDTGYVARLRIFNPDGSEAELSGNGAREAVLYLRRRGWTDADSFAIQTLAGDIRPRILSETECAVDMGQARLQSPGYPSGGPDGRGELVAGGRTWRFQHVQVGNPQCAIRVSDEAALGALDLGAVGPEIEHHELFPNRTNVSWFAELNDSDPAHPSIRARIFERGVGETSASGTGATGAAVAYVLDGGRPPVTVVLDGGVLSVEVSQRAGDRADGVGRAGVPRHARRDLPRGVACDAVAGWTGFPPYMFAELERKVRAKRAAGVDVISLGIGDPDTPTYPEIVAAMQRAVADPSTHQYPSNRGRQEFREAVAAFYARRFGVELDPETEVMAAIGAKECIFNLNLAFLDPGDVALASDPGYPVYTGGPLLAGGRARAAAPACPSGGSRPI